MRYHGSTGTFLCFFSRNTKKGKNMQISIKLSKNKIKALLKKEEDNTKIKTISPKIKELLKMSDY